MGKLVLLICEICVADSMRLVGAAEMYPATLRRGDVAADAQAGQVAEGIT